MAKTYTTNFKFLRIDPEAQFADEAFNDSVDDIDAKVGAKFKGAIVGWEPNTAYSVGRLVCYDAAIYKCVKGHISSTTFLPDMENWKIVEADVAIWEPSRYYQLDDTIINKRLVNDYVSYLCLKSHVSGEEFESDVGAGDWITCNYYPVKWQPSFSYDKYNFIVYVGEGISGSYYCNTKHISLDNFPADYAEGYWTSVDFTNFLTEWHPSMTYGKSQIVVRANAKEKKGLYVCIKAHTANDFLQDYNLHNWEQIGGNNGVIEKWGIVTDYVENQLVVYDSSLYMCLKDHTSSDFIQDFAQGYWKKIDMEMLIEDWGIGQRYKHNQLVRKGKKVYLCDIEHVAVDWESDISKWILVDGVQEWAEDLDILKGQLITKDDNFYIATSSFNTGIEFDDEKLFLLNPPSRLSEWGKNTVYLTNQLVRYKKLIYRAKEDFTSTQMFNPLNWEILTVGYAGNWKSSTVYVKNEIIINENKLYLCIKEHTSADFDAELENWLLLTSGGLSKWRRDTQYNTDDVVFYNSTLFICTASHKSTEDFDTTKWAITYSNIVPWASKVVYPENSVVIRNNEIYRCKVLHTSDDFTEEAETKWDKVGTGEAITVWAKDIAYDINQPVRYNDRIYICNTKHTSTTFEADKSKWDITYSSINSWATKIYYHIGTTVEKDGVIYKCKTAHTSNVFANDIDNWVALSASSLKDWEPAKNYSVGDIVLFKNVMYRCKTKHKSSAAFNTDEAKWNLIYNNIRLWDIDTPYKELEVVVQNGRLLICKEAHVSSHTDIKYDIDKWELIGATSDWMSEMPYFKWQIITNDGKLYRVKEDFVDKDFPENKVELISGVGGIVEWEEKTKYIEGQLILHENITYYATEDFKSDEEFNTDSLNILNIGYITNWKVGTLYAVDQCVYINRTIIQCTVKHTSAETYSEEESDNWKIIARSGVVLSPWTAETIYEKDEMILYDDTIYLSNIAHTSSNTFAEDMIKDEEKWHKLSADGGTISIWEKDIDYEKGQLVIVNNNNIYRCTTAHKSSKFAEDIENWEEISNGIQAWKSLTYYSVGTIIVLKDTFFRCIKAHISTEIFDESYTEENLCWVELSSSGYSQITKLGVKAHQTVTITVKLPLNFCSPPLEILKFFPTTSDVLVTENEFDNGEANDFEIAGQSAEKAIFVEFGNNKGFSTSSDGTMHLINEGHIPKESTTEVITDGLTEGYITKYKSFNVSTAMKSVSDWGLK